MTFSQSLRITFLLATALVLLAGGVEAQLSPALWQESISLEVQTIGVDNTSFMGSDPAVPESHTETLPGVGYEVTGSIQFGTGEFPEGTAQVTWDVSPSGASLDLFSSLTIDFYARVTETATPPVTVTEVPVHLVANGSATVVQFFGPRATSFFRFQVPTTTILITANLDLYGDPDSTTITDSFAIDETPMIPPNLTMTIGMSASASMGTVGTGGAATGTATGMIDPIIEVADQTIPGTAVSYRDYYTIEFSDGYDAQTPVRPTTFGKIKQKYIDQN